MTPDALAHIATLTAEVEQTEAVAMRANLALWAAVEPLATTVNACEALLDLVPAGFVRFKVRMALNHLTEPVGHP